MQKQDKQFVNPYTFVPFPADGIVRKQRPGHTFDAGEAANRYSGSFKVTWKVHTPLALPESENWYDSAGRTVEIPGSSAKGAVRSVHETLFGGCPRVLTESHIPVYRQLMKPGMVAGWSLAVVIDASEVGVPRTVRLCEPNSVMWINAVALRQAYGDDVPCTGDTLTLMGAPARHPGLKRMEYADEGKAPIPGDLAHIARDQATWEPGQHVFLVTDVAARKTTKNQHQNRKPIDAVIGGRPSREKKKQEVAGCYWAAGRLGDQLATFGSSEQQTAAAADFVQLSEGSRDRQKEEQALRKNPDAPPERFADVEWWTLSRGVKVRRISEDVDASNRNDPVVSASDDGHLVPRDKKLWHQIALRRRADARLYKGDVIWVRCEIDEGTTQHRVVAVKLAAAWRETPPEAGNLGRRVKPKPCHTAEELCLSCAIFGSIDLDGDGPGTGQQTSYRGHVRFGAIQGSGIEVGDPLTLAPLSSPRPGAGMFYLERRSIPPRTDEDRGDSPNRWGSVIDTRSEDPERRQVRGRKFYWHSDPDKQVEKLPGSVPDVRRQPRYKIASSGDGFQTAVRLVKSGQELTQKVTFDGLDRLSLLTLLAAFDPSRVLPLVEDGGDQYAIHLGGGKPFGLGTVSATISCPEVSSVAARYTSVAVPPTDWRWNSDDWSQLKERTGDLAEVHKAAAVVMRRRGLGDYEPYVTYPITKPWGDYGTTDFAKSFEFFQTNSGERLKPSRSNSGERPYCELPALRDVADGTSPTITSGETSV